jgi:hypothetical protein
MLHRTTLALIAAFLFVSVGALALRAYSRNGRGLPWLSEPVMIVVVSAADVRKVRELMDDERVVASAADGFAVRERWMVVADVEAAGPLLSQAGWTEAELQILKAGPRPRGTPGGGSAAGGSGLEALYGKPTLTLPEALRALQLLE